MRNVNHFVFVVLVWGCSLASGYELPELKIGVAISEDNLMEIAQESIPYARIRAADREHRKGDMPKSVSAFTSLDSGKSFWGVMQDGVIHKVNIDEKAHLGTWPLTRWEGEYLEGSLRNLYEDRLSGEGSWSSYGGSRDSEVACIASAPLRYGDLTGDGEPELVVFTYDHFSLDFHVFSPKHEEVVFTSKIMYLDDFHPDDEPESAGERRVQRRSRHVFAIENILAGRGLRAFSKMYFDDFNENGSKDLLIWRKLFSSNEVGEEEGFSLNQEKFLHYSIEDGRFAEQDAEEDVVQKWLKENHLRWVDGWPRKSECEGEEGKLIKEWHDPLLNDPDVLEGVDPETMTLVEDEEH